MMNILNLSSINIWQSLPEDIYIEFFLNFIDAFLSLFFIILAYNSDSDFMALSEEEDSESESSQATENNDEGDDETKSNKSKKSKESSKSRQSSVDSIVNKEDSDEDMISDSESESDSASTSPSEGRICEHGKDGYCNTCDQLYVKRGDTTIADCDHIWSRMPTDPALAGAVCDNASEEDPEKGIHAVGDSQDGKILFCPSCMSISCSDCAVYNSRGPSPDEFSDWEYNGQPSNYRSVDTNTQTASSDNLDANTQASSSNNYSINQDINTDNSNNGEASSNTYTGKGKGKAL